ncbi:MAG TPA: hypothetical protein PLF40_27750, partial [Kofleriaceae bacterium]|nr:hypothetical protein [Kofleriaceae bacterium]
LTDLLQLVAKLAAIQQWLVHHPQPKRSQFGHQLQQVRQLAPPPLHPNYHYQRFGSVAAAQTQDLNLTTCLFY